MAGDYADYRYAIWFDIVMIAMRKRYYAGLSLITIVTEITSLLSAAEDWSALVVHVVVPWVVSVIQASVVAARVFGVLIESWAADSCVAWAIGGTRLPGSLNSRHAWAIGETRLPGSLNNRHDTLHNLQGGVDWLLAVDRNPVLRGRSKRPGCPVPSTKATTRLTIFMAIVWA